MFKKFTLLVTLILGLKLLTKEPIFPSSSDRFVFIIAPRINAAGRMKHGNHAVTLLNEEDEALAPPKKKRRDQGAANYFIDAEVLLIELLFEYV